VLGLVGLAGLVAVAGVVSGGSAATMISARWGNAFEVPGSATLNSGGFAIVDSVSCATADSCAAGGKYGDGSGDYQAFVVSKTNGSWGKARVVPGSATLNIGGNAEVLSVSCTTAGNCAAGGSYLDGSGHLQAFVVSETHGSWGKARVVPGSVTLNSGNAQVNSVSCATAGNCAAGGSYVDGSGHGQAFVVSETNGSWGKARVVPGSVTLNSGGNAQVHSVSCATAGNCAAGGFYAEGSGDYQAFVVSETHGSWGKARVVPGSVTLNSGGFARVFSVSCTTVGNCAAGGFFAEGAGDYQAFVVSETHGSWGKARVVPGSVTLNSGGNAQVNSVSCATAGNCAAGGFYLDGSGQGQAFVVSETNGSWGKARVVPGSVTLNTGGGAQVNSVSCTTAGSCAAGGSYTDASGHYQVFVVSETHGSWGKAIEVPGSATLNSGGSAHVYTVSCATAGNCAAGGQYADGSSHRQAFLVNSTAP
jgi:hypothetical protein